MDSMGQATDENWWAQAVVYEVYPRSFKDSDGDGIGDLAGITSKIDYLADLGVDALWLTPFYPSELADGGYDVEDYRAIDPRLGTIDDFDALTAAAHARGLRVVVDLVPNHTSRLHPWFREAIASPPGSPARDRYLFRDGLGEHGEEPPTTWTSHFGGSTWERMPETMSDGTPDGQWYLHLFAWQQPDLNWDNAEVRADFERTLRFWCDHGTDGFRVDVAHGLAKDLDRPVEELDRWDAVGESWLPIDGSHPLYDRNELHDIYRSWRRVLDEYEPRRFAVGEAWVEPERQYLYASTDELGQVFNFDFAKSLWSRDGLHDAIEAGVASGRRAGSTSTWVLSNHDMVRATSRYALPQVEGTAFHQLAKDWLTRDGRSYHEDRALGLRRARAALLLELALPGSAYLWQGEELGLFEVADLPWDCLEDPTATCSVQAATFKGRDGCRVPLPWTSSDAPCLAHADDEFGLGGSFGFSPRTAQDGREATGPHLPQPSWFGGDAVDVESSDESSTLAFYREALRLRHTLRNPTDDLARMNDFQWLDEDAPSGAPDGAEGLEGGVIAYRRANGWACLANFGRQPCTLPEGRVLLTSAPLDEEGRLCQDACAWVMTGDEADR
ncbi:MAG: glycoside hydrolase family 13 protein [Atopobiaceae bacterium]|jgi:alpha-glucosidase|nr:glycoside hydrolase family 13 protein [Atopobiaceae bacterium]